MRRGSIPRLVLFAAVSAAAALAVAFLIRWLPKSASEEADRIGFVFWFTTAICVAIFAVVASVIIYSVFNFRAKPDDDSDGPPIHGHTGLEIAWTTVPAVLVTAISIVSAIVLGQNDHAEDPLHVRVIAQQFSWSFRYTDFGNLSSPTLNLPEGRSAKLTMDARDVVHSFWVPEFSQKQDAVPGLHPFTMVTPKRKGTFPVVCTELCGLGHAIMRAKAVVMSQKDFTAWVNRRRKALDEPQGNAGLAVFRAQGCGGCHALEAADTEGGSGPDLDKLGEQARRAGKPLEPFIEQSIVSPSAYIEPGYSDIMPHNYEEQIPPDQMRSLVQFLVAQGKGGNEAK